MSRPVKPTELKLRDGDRTDRINVDEPKSPKGLPDPPTWLDEYGAEGYREFADRLAEMGLGCRADGQAAALYALNYSLLRRILDDMAADDGLTHKTKTTRKAHPLFVELGNAQKVMFRILSQFGCTPASRASLRFSPDEGNDALAQFERGELC